jgi:hypothetical protein
MKKFLTDHWLYVAGAVFGAIAGLLYYQFVGCNSGTCAITSKPVNSTVYFGAMGALIFGMFEKKKNGEKSDQEKQ